MNNKKRNIHTSGPLGMLVKNGQVKKVELEENLQANEDVKLEMQNGSYFRTQDGIEFKEKELIFVKPEDCKPWKYANRLDDEMGDIEELIKSIKENGQLQPGLVRTKRITETDKLSYEIIFGRRRHVACLRLGIPFLVIKKESINLQDAIAFQDAENKLRKDVSNYSNALLYEKLIKDKVFSSQKELSEKLMVSPATLNELMAYSRIPKEIVQAIPNIHTLSISMALKILEFLSKSASYKEILLSIAPEIGKAIKSTVKLEKAITNSEAGKAQKNFEKAFIIKDDNDGEKFFSFKLDSRGAPCITLNKNLSSYINYEELCNYLKEYMKKLKNTQADEKFGYPN